MRVSTVVSTFRRAKLLEVNIGQRNSVIFTIGLCKRISSQQPELSSSETNLQLRTLLGRLGNNSFQQTIIIFQMPIQLVFTFLISVFM